MFSLYPLLNIIFQLTAYIFIVWCKYNIPAYMISIGDDYMDEVVSLIGNVGFPIAVSIYLLIRIEGKLENLTTSINNLSVVINNAKK